jgi:response regulator RpfG family c-di-GMP phosphodiesterase
MIEIPKDALTSFIRVMASAMDAGDPYTHGRAYRCSKYAVRVGRRMGMCDPDLQNLEYAGLLQDLAKKIAFHTIRHRPRSLYPSERLQMNQHAQISAAILRRIPFLERAAGIIECLNERYDGRGLPNHLRWEEIPLPARILAVVSALDAMVSDRPHRARLSTEGAYAELRNEAGQRFDPRVVDIVIQLHSTGEIAADLDRRMSFLYTIPEEKPQEPEADSLQENLASSDRCSPRLGGDASPLRPGDASPFQMLIVDDDDIDREAIERAFRRGAFETKISMARDGEEGLNVLRAVCSAGDAPPPVILLDLNMPNMNGLQLLGQLRGDPELRRCLVFVLSTSDDPRDKQAAYDQNVAGYLVKSRLGPGFSRLPEVLYPYLSSIEFPMEQVLAA